MLIGVLRASPEKRDYRNLADRVLFQAHVNFWTDHIFLFPNNCVKR
jgi:hypothetical protein